MDGKYYNLWSTDNERTDNNDGVVIKSVYDPSPVGYSLPASNAFTGFTTTGQQVGNWTIPATSEQVNAKFPFDKGWYFYTKPRKTGNTSFFYASGFRNHNSGRFNDLSSVGGCWVAGPYHAEFGHSLYLGARSIVHPINYFYNSFGWSVRSAEEKEWRKVDVGCGDLQCADFRCASSSPRTAWVPSIYDVMDDTVAHCNSLQLTKRLTL